MSDSELIAKRVKKIIAEHLVIPLEEVKSEANLIDDLGMDSLDGIELLMATEEEFDIEIKNGDAETWVTVQDVIDGLERVT